MAVYQILSQAELMYRFFSRAEDYINYLIAAMIILSCYWYLISKFRPHRGHFISIILIAACSLLIQLYLSVYAGFHYVNIDPAFGYNLAALLNIPGDMDCLVSFMAVLSLEALILVIISIVNSRRITPDVIFFFFLSFMSFLLFPGTDTLRVIAAGWCLWCAAPPLLRILFDRIGGKPLIKRGPVHIPALSLALAAVVILFAVSVFLGHTGAPNNAQLLRFKVFSAAGGDNGLGLYNGRFRSDSPLSQYLMIIGVLFEELGFKTGALCVFLVLLAAYGCYFQGLRAEKYYTALICFLIAVFIGLSAAVNLASVTGAAADVMGFRLNAPPFGLPMPFLSQSAAPLIILFICLAIVESVKLSRRIQPAVPVAEDVGAENENSEIICVNTENENNEIIYVNAVNENSEIVEDNAAGSNEADGELVLTAADESESGDQ